MNPSRRRPQKSADIAWQNRRRPARIPEALTGRSEMRAFQRFLNSEAARPNLGYRYAGIALARNCVACGRLFSVSVRLTHSCVWVTTRRLRNCDRSMNKERLPNLDTIENVLGIV